MDFLPRGRHTGRWGLRLFKDCKITFRKTNFHLDFLQEGRHRPAHPSPGVRRTQSFTITQTHLERKCICLKSISHYEPCLFREICGKVTLNVTLMKRVKMGCLGAMTIFDSPILIRTQLACCDEASVCTSLTPTPVFGFAFLRGEHRVSA